MKKVKIASVTLLLIGKVKIFVMVDTYNHVCKFHIDYNGDLDPDTKAELTDKVYDFAGSLCSSDIFGLEFSETSKDEVFKYLPKKFC